jgi:hypothetical protein
MSWENQEHIDANAGLGQRAAPENRKSGYIDFPDN